LTSYANQTIRLQKQSLPVFPTQTSFTQLFGDTFAQKSADSLYILEDLTGIGATLTNNNTATFDSITDLTIKPVNVVTLDGVDQYLSTGTAVANQVGSGSFVASCWFKTTDTNSFKVIISYGDEVGGGANWYLRINNDGNISAKVDDGTFAGFTTTSTIPQFEDDNWHIGSLVIDKTIGSFGEMFILVDGIEVARTTFTQALDSLDDADGLFIGAGNNTNPTTFFAGQLSNASLYFPDTTGTLQPDYNLPALMEAGLRESAAQTTTPPVIDLGVSGQRINNRFFNNATVDNEYFTSVVNTSEGIYDILFLNTTNTNVGITKIDIDGQTNLTIDGNGALDRNVQTVVSGIFLSAGTHLLKVKTDGTSGGGTDFAQSWAMIELIKRDGGNEGDNESSSGVLFGDEIQQVSNDSLTFQAQTLNFYNNQFNFTNIADGNFTEGTLFLKKGLYKITVTYLVQTNAGNLDMFFGGVKVFDQLDMSDTLARNTQSTVSAFLEGGETVVRVAVNGGDVSFDMGLTSIRYELVSGKSNGADVNVMPADTDIQTVSGVATHFPDISTIARFNTFQTSSGAAAIGDKFQFNRYFSGGTYRVKYLYRKQTAGGISNVGINDDDTAIFTGIDHFQTGNLFNFVAETTVTIPRGFQDITWTTTGTSNTGFNVTFQRLQFTKIGDVENTEDDNSDPVHGAMVPLASLKSPTATGTFTVDLGGVDIVNRFSKILVQFTGESNAAQEIQGVINDARGATDYRQDGFQVIAGAVTGVDLSLAEIRLIPSTILTGAGAGFLAEFDISNIFDGTVNGIAGKWNGGSGNLGTSNGQYIIAGAPADTEVINQITLETSSGTVKIGGQLLVYGILR